MPWMRLRFTPGVNRNTTNYSADGTWYDCNLVRFRDGFPESWSGWERFLNDFTFSGKCRSMHSHADLAGQRWLSLGTNSHFYIGANDIMNDVTPIEQSVTLGNDPFSVVDGNDVVTVTHVNHGKTVGARVVFSGATGFAGIPAGDLNKEHFISFILSNDEYLIIVDTLSTSTASGGGSNVQADYVLSPGSESQFHGEIGSWGALTWGEDAWGGGSVATADKMGMWTQSNWGEDLVACNYQGNIYYWDRTNPTDRMVDILDMPGADGNAPENVSFITVSSKDRHLLAFGGTEFGSSNYSPISIRWCSQENILNWNEADTTGTAGSIPLSRGSRFMAVQPTSKETLVWTDAALFALQYVGAPYIYTVEMIAEFSDITGNNSATIYNDAVYWMGRSGFYVYMGRVEKIPCAVWDYINRRVDYDQAMKIYASTNRQTNEIIWFYPSKQEEQTGPGGGITSPIGEVDSYVAFSMESGIWTYGTLDRTAWIDVDALNLPYAASTDGRLFQHEIGNLDGSTTPPTPINAYIESAPIELSSEGSFDKGDRFMFIRRILHDVTFRSQDTSSEPSMNIVLKMMNKPGGGFGQTSSSQADRTAILPVEEFTEESFVRLRGRALVVRAETNSPSLWRLGTPRIDVRTDGQK
jgi:hypothetical protein